MRIIEKQRMWTLLFLLFTYLTSCDSFNRPLDDDGTIVIGTRVNTPKGRVFYLGAYAGIPEQVDAQDMLMLGSDVSIYSYGKHPYVWDGTTSRLKKYAVNNKMNLEALDSIDLGGIANRSSFGSVAFISETEAYVFFLGEGKVVQFDPSTMKVSKLVVTDVLPGGPDPKIGTNTYYSFITNDTTVLLPVGANPGNFGRFPDRASVAVFNTKTKVVKYNMDRRMSIGYHNFAQDVANGELYYRPSKYIARIRDYVPAQHNPPIGGILRMRSDGTYDPDFFIDLEKILNAHCILSVINVRNKEALVQYIEHDWNVPKDPGEWYSGPTQVARVNLETLNVETNDYLNTYGALYPVGEVDGKQYYSNFGADDDKYHFLEFDDSGDFIDRVTSVSGSGIYIARLK